MLLNLRIPLISCHIYLFALQRIETRFGPSEDSKITGFYIEPGDTVQVAAAWTSDESHEEWFKLVGDRGWVARKDPVFKRDQFQK